MRKLALMLCLLLSLTIVQAQREDLQNYNTRIETQIDAFGLEQDIIVGQIMNRGDVAYENISVFADLLDADGEIIGEAFGFMVDQCGEAILDFPLQPQQARRFVANVDLYEVGEIEDIELFFDSTETEPETAIEIDLSEAVTKIASGEVVSVEWGADGTLLYGIGCDARVFTTYDWYRYTLNNLVITPLDANPKEEFISEAFIRQTGIMQFSQSGGEDPALFERSFLTFPSQTRRIIYQTDIHNIITAETDGSFKRIVHTFLHQRSLQGFIWSPIGNFVAYYFGAYGEPVYYFTASPSNGLISALLPNNIPSATIPGLTDDARRVIISGNFENAEGETVAGYWLSSVISQQRELLFEVDELAGNNYPAPAYYRKDASTRYIYVIRPIDGIATLQCFYREGDELRTLTQLPLQLSTDERAWSWLSPDNRTLAIAANGDHGGLWLVDLSGFGVCR
jgi:hypothetical protein